MILPIDKELRAAFLVRKDRLFVVVRYARRPPPSRRRYRRALRRAPGDRTDW
jgi:hypothetical protein